MIDDDTVGISAATRRFVMIRDNWRCRKCGEMDTAKLTLHHVVFRSQSGGDEASNLVTLCGMCHRLLHDKIIAIMMIDGVYFFRDERHWRHRSALRYRRRNGDTQ